MVHSENEGFRAYFQHADNAEYTVLLKGYNLEKAVEACRKESLEQSVAFVRLEVWTRAMNSDRGKSLLWCRSDGDRWE